MVAARLQRGRMGGVVFSTPQFSAYRAQNHISMISPSYSQPSRTYTGCPGSSESVGAERSDGEGENTMNEPICPKVLTWQFWLLSHNTARFAVFAPRPFALGCRTLFPMVGIPRTYHAATWGLLRSCDAPYYGVPRTSPTMSFGNACSFICKR